MFIQTVILFLCISTCVSQTTAQSLFPRNPNIDCICVKSYLCGADNKVITDGTDLVNLNRFDQPDLAPEFIPNTDPNWPQCHDETRKCCNKPDYDFQACGQRTESAGIRVLGSDDDILFQAHFTEFPWTMALFTIPTSSKDLKYLCGATLLSPKIAITVVHNIDTIGNSTLILRAGEFDMTSTNETVLHQERTIQKIIKHPDFNLSSFENDLAILTWNQPLDMNNPNVGVICLPEKDEIFYNQDCVASGWGKSVKSSSAPYADIMKLIELDVVERNECLNRVRNIYRAFILYESIICAGGEAGKDTCKGDGGSPLVCKKSNEKSYKLAGLVSSGIGCGRPIPAIYVNIAYLSEWLKQEMSKIN